MSLTFHHDTHSFSDQVILSMDFADPRDPEDILLPRCIRCGRRYTLYGPGPATHEAVRLVRLHSRCRLCRALAAVEGAFQQIDPRTLLARLGIQALEGLYELLLAINEYTVDRERNLRRRLERAESEDEGYSPSDEPVGGLP